jgi:hypothetical protein
LRGLEIRSATVTHWPSGSGRSERRIRVALLAVLAACVVVLGGRGGLSAEQKRARHLVAVGNATCREFRANARGDREPPANENAPARSKLAALRALLAADRNLPNVGAYLADAAKRRRLMAETETPGFVAPGRNRRSLIDELHAADVKIQADLRAIGLTSCIGTPPKRPIGG